MSILFIIIPGLLKAALEHEGTCVAVKAANVSDKTPKSYSLVRVILAKSPGHSAK